MSIMFILVFCYFFVLVFLVFEFSCLLVNLDIVKLGVFQCVISLVRTCLWGTLYLILVIQCISCWGEEILSGTTIGDKKHGSGQRVRI